MQAPSPISPPELLLLGPGPSPTAPSIYEALAKPTVGHLDPAFLAIMDEVRAMLRAVFRTENAMTMPMSGTGSAGMETCFVNLLSPGDRVLVGVNGVFGTRMCDVARRCGAEAVAVEGEWGRALTADQFRAAAAADGGSFDLVCVVHAETSTGARTDVPPIREVANELDALLLVDCVTSLGGIPVEIDAWGVDAVYSGTQKCLGCPPGLAPISFSERAADRLRARTTPVQSWYLDLGMIASYWGTERVYHHTAPINMLYGLHEALRLVLDEGLEARWARHEANAQRFWAGLDRLGLELAAPADERLIPLTAIRIPDGVDDAAVRGHLLSESKIEIGGGLGPLKGKVWRVGLMGHGSSEENVDRCLAGLEAALAAQR